MSFSPAPPLDRGRLPARVDNVGPTRQASTPPLPPIEPVSLKALMTIYLSAKRSLTSTSLVIQANDLATEARAAVDDHVAACARNSFLKHGVSLQIAGLEALWNGLEKMKVEYTNDFQAYVDDLDRAAARATSELEQLQNIRVHPYFRPKNELPRSLDSFVDIQQVPKLQQQAAESISQFNDAHNQVVEAIDKYYSELQALRTMYDNVAAGLDQPIQLPAEKPASAKLLVPTIFRHIEAQAVECGRNLQSLVDHFDRCTTVLNHTDGGDDAIRRMGPIVDDPAAAAAAAAAVDLPAGSIGADRLSGSSGGIDAENDMDTQIAEMAVTVQQDALEVDDVVAEIADRVDDMVAHHRRLFACLRGIHTGSVALRELVEMVRVVTVAAEGYVAVADSFRNQWQVERVNVAAHLTKLGEIANFRVGLVYVYDRLLIEAERREGMEQAIRDQLLSMVRQLDVWADRDRVERVKFREYYSPWIGVAEQVWPRLAEEPVRWQVMPVASASASAETDDLTERKTAGSAETSVAARLSSRTIDRVYGVEKLPSADVDPAAERVEAHDKAHR